MSMRGVYQEDYYSKYAAAYVRGSVLCERPSGPLLSLPDSLLEKSLDELTEDEAEAILDAGNAAGLKLYYFKKTHGDLPRVKRVLGFFRSIEMRSLLDVGSGRGVFLWPCLNAFPRLEVTGLDVLPHRVKLLNMVRQGGAANLNAVAGDICSQPAREKSHDVVTMLEVLEHISDPSAAIRAASQIAKKFVVVSVPSKPDNNPEHIHLLTKDILTDLFVKAGCGRLHFDGAPGHLIMVAALEEK